MTHARWPGSSALAGGGYALVWLRGRWRLSDRWHGWWARSFFARPGFLLATRSRIDSTPAHADSPACCPAADSSPSPVVVSVTPAELQEQLEKERDTLQATGAVLRKAGAARRRGDTVQVERSASHLPHEPEAAKFGWILECGMADHTDCGGKIAMSHTSFTHDRDFPAPNSGVVGINRPQEV